MLTVGTQYMSKSNLRGTSGMLIMSECTEYQHPYYTFYNAVIWTQTANAELLITEINDIMLRVTIHFADNAGNVLMFSTDPDKFLLSLRKEI